MSELLKDSRPTARKRHACMECGRVIEPGERYVSQFVVDGGESWTWKGCVQCTTS